MLGSGYARGIIYGLLLSKCWDHREGLHLFRFLAGSPAPWLALSYLLSKFSQPHWSLSSPTDSSIVLESEELW